MRSFSHRSSENEAYSSHPRLTARNDRLNARNEKLNEKVQTLVQNFMADDEDDQA